MMKDWFDVIADAISLFDVPEFRANITGDIYAGDRPAGSKKIDVVVNCLGVTNEPMQQGTGNVNIHAPNLSSGRPDSVTLRRIAKALIPYLEHQHRATFQTNLEEAGKLSQDSDGTWYYNIPFEYYSVQEKYYNV
jgi:hypothetical protein